jgi:hypothetical protein
MKAARSSIFISYRRSDAADVSGRIFDRLEARFGRSRVFKDVDSVPIASEFGEYILNQIEQSVVVVLIGPTWATCGRLDEADDFVRLEIEAALRLQVPIIPTLVTNASMPDRNVLPESIRALAGLQGMKVRPDPDFGVDIGKAIAKLEQFIELPSNLEEPSHSLIEQLRKDCQDWYNEIVHVIAKIISVLKDSKLDTDERRTQAEALNFIYVNTRTYLPRVLSARHSLAHCSGTDSLARAVDRFLSTITIDTNDKNYSPWCRPPLHWLIQDDVLWGSAEDNFTRATLDISLDQARDALLVISNEVDMLLHRR